MKVEKKPQDQARLRAHLLIIEARFYDELCDELARGAAAVIEAAGASWERLAVPGSLELPGAIVLAEQSKRFDGYVALGCVLRGETSHYDIVAGESARGIMDLTMKGICIGNGVLTCETEAQAWARARVGQGDKGGAAATAALALIRLKRQLNRKAKAR
jgi:6,7-dimethyl-8-ribityllumazine synthase